LNKTKATCTQPIAFLTSLQHLPDVFKFLVMDNLLVPVQKIDSTTITALRNYPLSDTLM